MKMAHLKWMIIVSLVFVWATASALAGEQPEQRLGIGQRIEKVSTLATSVDRDQPGFRGPGQNRIPPNVITKRPVHPIPHRQCEHRHQGPHHDEHGHHHHHGPNRPDGHSHGPHGHHHVHPRPFIHVPGIPLPILNPAFALGAVIESK